MNDANMLTVKELAAITAFINESVDNCGEFSEDQNLSYMNTNDLAKSLNVNKHTASGLFSALSEKGLIADCNESARNAPINDWVACPETCATYPQLASLF